MMKLTVVSSWTLSGQELKEARAAAGSRVKFWFKSIWQRLRNLQPIMKAIAKDWIEAEQDWLDSEGRGTWKPLNKRYALYKQKRWGQKKILQRGMFLYNSITGKRAGTIRIRGSELQILAPRYWQAHQKGVPRRNLPQRIVVPPNLMRQPTSPQRKRMMTRLKDWLLKAKGSYGIR